MVSIYLPEFPARVQGLLFDHSGRAQIFRIVEVIGCRETMKDERRTQTSADPKSAHRYGKTSCSSERVSLLLTLPVNGAFLKVTGASGFLASHLISLLLAEGYAVRGTARSGKMESLRAAPIADNPDFSLVQIDDIATSDLSGALKCSVLSLIMFHCILLKTARNGTLNVLASALKTGVLKVVLTSSWATTQDPSLEKTYNGVVFSEKDWSGVSEEEFLRGDHDVLWGYLAIKTLVEKMAWKFAQENPTLDLATKKKRFLVSGGHFTWKEAVEYLEESRPDLESRLPPVTCCSFQELPGKLSSIDVTRARDILHMEGYIGWESTVGDTISSLLIAEEMWARG
ncbi:hypothetical protein F5146DRAFT_1005119 [Armillaria mellea]|nr:hypothetical protein F5146DRAFT_1005119 [Armillaria mellea]